MPSPININMADLPSDETELAYSTVTLLQLNSGEKTSVGEECPTMYKLKQYLRQPRRGVRFTTANPRELRTVDDDGNEHPFREESYEALEHFLPFLNHLQNEHGPMQKGHIDARNYTRDDFEAFMGNFPGEYIEYDQAIAWENYKRNGRQYEERHSRSPPVSSSSRQRSDNSSTGSAPSNEEDLTAEEKLELRTKMDYFNMYFKIRRPMNDYSFILEEDDQFPEYNHHLITTSKAHGTWFLLNLDKDPMDVCLHEAVYANANANLYLVFTTTLKTAKGIECVKDNVDNARALYTSLLEYYTGNSTHAKMSARRIYEDIVQFRVPSKSDRVMAIAEYITLFKDRIKSHNDYVDPGQRIEGEDMMIHFHSAFDTVPELEITTSNLEKDEINGITYTPQQVIQQYENAALRADDRAKKQRALLPGVSRLNAASRNKLTANVLEAFFVADDDRFDMNDAYTFEDDHQDGYEVSLAEGVTSRMPNDLWKIVSDDDKKWWLSLDTSTRQAFVGLFRAYLGTVETGEMNNDSSKSITNSTRYPSKQQSKSSGNSSRRSVSKAKTQRKTSEESRRVNFHDTDVDGESGEEDTEEEERGEESYVINKCSLLDTVKSPMPKEMVANKSITVVSEGATGVPATNLLRIMSQSQPDIPIKDDISTDIKPRSLGEAYGERKTKPTTAQIASKLIKGVKKKSAGRQQAHMLLVEEPYVLDNDIPRSRLDILDGHPIPPSGFERNEGPMKSVNNRDGIHPMEERDPTDLSFDDIIADSIVEHQEFAVKSTELVIIDRGSNNGMAGPSCENIGWSDKYVNIHGIHGVYYKGLRLGDFQVVMTLYDPITNEGQEEICIFRNYASYEDPEERAKLQTVHSALQLEDSNICVEDNKDSARRITFSDGKYVDILFVNGIPRVVSRRPTAYDKILPIRDVTGAWDATKYDLTLSQDGEMDDESKAGSLPDLEDIIPDLNGENVEDTDQDEPEPICVEPYLEELYAQSDSGHISNRSDEPSSAEGTESIEEETSLVAEDATGDSETTSEGLPSEDDDTPIDPPKIALQWEQYWEMEHVMRSVLIQLKEKEIEADRERDLTFMQFGVDSGIPSSKAYWILYVLRHGKFIQSVRYMERFHQAQVIQRYEEKGKGMAKIKLNIRIRKMAPIHDYIDYMTRISRRPWDKPSYVPFHESGNDHTDHTIVMHPQLVINYLRVYHLDERDVIEGLMFGDKMTYSRLAGHYHYLDPGISGFTPVPQLRKFRDYSKFPNEALEVEECHEWNDSD